jgi:hypothetical protein
MVPARWSPLGECIGWVDKNDVYLEPTASFRAVQVAGRDIGELLPISPQTLRKRIHDKCLLASVDEPRGTLTVRRSISGSSKNVLHFHRNTTFLEISDADEDAI